MIQFEMKTYRQAHNAITRAAISEASILATELNEPGNLGILTMEAFYEVLQKRMAAARQREPHKWKRLGAVDIYLCQLTADGLPCGISAIPQGKPVLRIRKPRDTGRDIATVSLIETENT